jgi:hypothetical protein
MASSTVRVSDVMRALFAPCEGVVEFFAPFGR